MEYIEPTWTIVKFIQDNSVAAVPTKWIRDDDECLWPPFSYHKLHSAIKSQTTDAHWPSYKVQIFRNATYGTYEKALTKAKLAEDTSDLTTSDADDSLKKRKLIKRRHIVTSDSDSEADDVGIAPSKLPAPPTLLRTLPASHSQTNELSDNEDNLLCLKNTSLPNQTEEVVKPSLKLDDSLSKQKKPIDEVGSFRSTPRLKMTELGTPQVSGMSREVQCTCCPKHAEVNKEMLRQIYFLRSLTSDIMEEIRSRKYKDTVQPEKSNSIFLKFNFPLCSEEDLASFNLYLREDQNFNEAINEISKFGGKNSLEYVKRTLGALIKNNLATEYSWLGRRDKKSFCNLEIAKLILKSSEKLNDNTHKEVEVAIQGWLKRAPERAKKD